MGQLVQKGQGQTEGLKPRIVNKWALLNGHRCCDRLASIFTGIPIVQKHIYLDRKTQHRELVRRGRKTKKPYFAKRAVVRQALEDINTREQKALQGVYDVIVIDPPWPVAVQHRELYENRVALDYPT